MRKRHILLLLFDIYLVFVLIAFIEKELFLEAILLGGIIAVFTHMIRRKIKLEARK